MSFLTLTCTRTDLVLPLLITFAALVFCLVIVFVGISLADPDRKKDQ